MVRIIFLAFVLIAVVVLAIADVRGLNRKRAEQSRDGWG